MNWPDKVNGLQRAVAEKERAIRDERFSEAHYHNRAISHLSTDLRNGYENTQSGLEPDIIELRLPEWMVKQLLGCIRHSKHTSVTQDGRREAEKVEMVLEMVLREQTRDNE